MEEKAKNEGTTLALYLVKCQVITFIALWRDHLCKIDYIETYSLYFSEANILNIAKLNSKHCFDV